MKYTETQNYDYKFSDEDIYTLLDVKGVIRSISYKNGELEITSQTTIFHK